MNLRQWTWLKQLLALLETPRPDPAQHTRRIVALQRHIILPARLLAIAIAIAIFFSSPWQSDERNTYAVVFESILNGFAVYVLFILAVTVLFYVARKFPPRGVQALVFTVGLADGIFLGALTFLTDGFNSIFFWVYPVMIVLNAFVIAFATPQIFLNLALGIIFMVAGILEVSWPINLELPALKRPGITSKDIKEPLRLAAWINDIPEPFRKPIQSKMSSVTMISISNSLFSGVADERLTNRLVAEANLLASPTIRTNPLPAPRGENAEPPADPNVLRVAVLVLLTFCCYGVQLLIARERRLVEDRQEFIVRTEQLRSAGRLAAEIAHQIKNPLAIINNVTWSLRKSLGQTRPDDAQQLEIIREEVGKADRVITQIMGYAQLSEGRVEAINIVEEINRAIADVFPPGVPTKTNIVRNYAGEFPTLLMQPRHFYDAVSNLLQNARDAADGVGEISITARRREDLAVEIVIRDNGPGIAPDKIERVFEAYYTTKTRGTGLGLSVVKHNAELYGGSVRVESELGKGAAFTLVFPAKTFCELT
ncbi:MAG: GHKL domain-containing protein [Verrucomicrobia bacterium]|nr:GHKL domain-containing protein [Verrucomicrobiota bacterium]